MKFIIEVYRIEIGSWFEKVEELESLLVESMSKVLMLEFVL